MPNEISQDGTGNVAFQDVENSIININQLLGKSVQYQELIDQLNTKKELLSYIPEDEFEKRLTTSKQINDLESLLKQFKKDVLRLAEAFSQVEINTKRLIQAKEFFDTGEFDKSRAFLEVEIVQMKEEQDTLLRKQNEHEENILPQLKHNSEEFLVLGISTMFGSESSEKFGDACNYFECSIKSFQTKENTFIYAKFLQDYHQFPKSQIYYEQYLEDFDSELTQSEKSSGLNNLAVIYDYQHEYDKAIAKHEEALEIRKELAESKTEKCLADVSTTLNNLALIFDNQNKYDEALKMYKEALKIRRELADKDKIYLPYLGTTLHNLAGVYVHKGDDFNALKLYLNALEIYHELAMQVSSEYLYNYSGTLNNMANIYENWGDYKDALKSYKDSLLIIRDLAKTNPKKYLNQLAGILNNIGNAYRFNDDFENAEQSYYEALEICQNLAKSDSKSYIPLNASILGNLAEFFIKCKSNREKSIGYALETIKLLLPIVKQVPFTHKCLRNAQNSLNEWNYVNLGIENQINQLESH